MTKPELLEMFALDVIADDYESWQTVLDGVSALSRSCGLTVDKLEIAGALCALVEKAFATAYSVSSSHSFEPIRGMPSSDELERSYFGVTAQGRQLQLADFPDWPFDSRGSLKPDWSFPCPHV